MPNLTFSSSSDWRHNADARQANKPTQVTFKLELLFQFVYNFIKYSKISTYNTGFFNVLILDYNEKL